MRRRSIGRARSSDRIEKEGALMLRDIDYAATAVKKAIVEKFGQQNPTAGLVVMAKEKTIAVQDGERIAEETRDNLLAAVRKAESYEQFWQAF
jgi:hypothetical protein